MVPLFTFNSGKSGTSENGASLIFNYTGVYLNYSKQISRQVHDKKITCSITNVRKDISLKVIKRKKNY